MAVTVIDTVRYARRLKDAGVPAEQAEAMADAIGAELVDQLATKADIESAVATLDGKITGAAATLRKATVSDVDFRVPPSIQGHDSFLVDMDRFRPAVASSF